MQEPAAILATTDYGKFKLMDFNRAISREHVQNLIKSFEAHPEVVAATPIIVNEHMEVVDGQHRLEACKALKLPVHYLVVPGANIASTQMLNAIQREWRLLDYARSYAGSGNPHYQKYLQWLEEYPMAPSALIALVFNMAGGGTVSKLFRAGAMKVEDALNVEQRLSVIAQYREITDRWGTPGFVRAVTRLSKLEGFEHERMQAQLKTHELHTNRGSGQREYLRALETIYNKGKHNYLRFFE